MKTKIFFAVITFLLISMATVNVFLNKQEKKSLSTLALINLNALAENENGENPGGGENPGSGDFKYKIDKDPCEISVASEAQANFIAKFFGIKASVGAKVNLTHATALYRLGGDYRLGTDKTCAMLASEIISAASK